MKNYKDEIVISDHPYKNLDTANRDNLMENEISDNKSNSYRAKDPVINKQNDSFSRYF
jgi:hypothetical protein